MTATKVRSAEDQALVEERLVEWKDFLNVKSPRQVYLAEEHVAASVRITRCRKEEDDWRSKRAARAQDGTWESDRRGEAAELGKGLARNPRVVAPKLRGSYHGAEWMLAEWRSLAEAIRNPQSKSGATGNDQAAGPAPLDEAGRAKACDLLGLAAEHRNGRTPLDLPQGGATDAALAAHQAALVAREIGALERLQIDELSSLEAMEKTAAAEGRATGIPRELRLIRRYHAAAQRDYDRWLAELRAEQERAAKAAADEVFNIIGAAKLRREQERRAREQGSQKADSPASGTPSAPAAAEIVSVAASHPESIPAQPGPEVPSHTLRVAETGLPDCNPRPGEMAAMLDGILARISRKEEARRVARSADRGTGPK
jgi:hypothetical protein